MFFECSGSGRIDAAPLIHDKLLVVSGGQKNGAVRKGRAAIYKGEIEEKLSRSSCCISMAADYGDVRIHCQSVLLFSERIIGGVGRKLTHNLLLR